ncbi:MAG: hypothetical protein Kow0026_09530 [Oricola sp.]
MGFKTTLIGAVLLSGAFGGGLAYVNSSGGIDSVGDVTASARNVFRSTMRKFDNRYYTRGPDYGICVADYGRGAIGKTNAEITLACECFDKSLRALRGADQESARIALQPPSPPPGGQAGDQVATLRTTPAAKAVLDKCGIKPPRAGFLSMRGTM